MNYEFPILRDLPLWIKGPADRPVPQAQLFEIAESLDLTLLFFGRCREYIRQVLQQLRALRVQPDSPVLDALSDDQVETLVARPFRTRNEAELRQIQLELLAANPVAIDQLFERLASEPLSDEWLEIHDAECDRIARKDGIGWIDVEALAAKLGIKLDAGNLAFADAERGEESSDDASAQPLVLRWHIAADDAEHIRWEKGAAQDSHAKHLDVQITADTADQLSVILGGIGYIETGCKLTARWLDSENNLNAETSAQDQDHPLVLDNSTETNRKPLSALHRLELRFERSSPTPLFFTATIPLHEPPRAAP